MKRLAVRIAVATLALGSTTACAATSSPPPKYVQIGYPAEITDLSYCLRTKGRDPVHVRKVQSYDVFRNTGDVIIDKAFNNSAGACKVANPPILLEEQDQVEITGPDGGPYALQIYRKDGSKRFANGALPLTPSDNLSMFAADNDSGYDYFVMFADGGHGNPGTKGESPIDKYYHIEVFPALSTGPTLSCMFERPNLHLPVATPNGPVENPINIYLWDGDPESCFEESHETSTGGGGEHPGHPLPKRKAKDKAR